MRQSAGSGEEDVAKSQEMNEREKNFQHRSPVWALCEHCVSIVGALREALCERCVSIAWALREHCVSIARALRALREHCVSIAWALREHCRQAGRWLASSLLQSQLLTRSLTRPLMENDGAVMPLQYVCRSAGEAKLQSKIILSGLDLDSGLLSIKTESTCTWFCFCTSMYVALDKSVC